MKKCVLGFWPGARLFLECGRHIVGSCPDSDWGQSENRPCRIWADERHSRRLQQYPRFGQPYCDYLLPFELAAVLLLLGMVAAIALVHRKTVNPKRMDPADQVKVRADQRPYALGENGSRETANRICRESEVSDDLKPKEEGKA